MTPVNFQPPNFSKTRRIVLLVDLCPFLTLSNPSSYLRGVTAVASRLLHFPPLFAALSAYKFFFSSLSPIRSAAVLPGHLSFSKISFNLASETLDSLSKNLNSIASVVDWQNSPCSARASYTAGSLLQLIHYAWEKMNDGLSFEDDGDLGKIPSNLVILLSPISQSVHPLADYLELRMFDEAFCGVRDAFVARDIHLCWIDVKNDELKIEGVDEKKFNCGTELANLKDGIRKLGWGFCSSDLIILGSSLLPLSLIYPKIGMSFDFAGSGDLNRRQHRGELSLEILDVNSKPLECKCCDLEFLSLHSLPGSIKTDDVLNGLESIDIHGQDSFWVHLGRGNFKLLVKSIHRYELCEKIGASREAVLVRECFQELRKSKKISGGNLFADSLLELLHSEMGGTSSKDQIPIWQMFLSFLHMKGCWALVSLSGNNGVMFMGSLMPFTTHLAIINNLDAGCASFGSKFGSKVAKMEEDEGMNDSNRCFGSQSDTGNFESQKDRKMKKNQRQLYQEMTWSSFCKAAFEGSNFDLFELYMVRHLEKSKKLKFLRCWMKQIGNVSPCCSTTLPGIELEEASVCNVPTSEPSPEKGGAGAGPVSKSETSETFFSNLSERILQGLESGKDLQNLAERVVKSSVHWLQCHKCDSERNSKDKQLERSSDGPTDDTVCEKLVEILLRAPKEMTKIPRDFDPCSSPDNIFREYELQILLRMEIMRSDVSAGMGRTRKRKMLKEICNLLEIVQFLIPGGGVFGHITLYDYVERTLKARYSEELGDVVDKIYTKLDLLPFGDEDETPSLLFNSEDSNQSWRDNKHDKTEKLDAQHSFSAEGESSQPLPCPHESPQKTEEDHHARILNEARERRERARRFAPFIGKARDLQRVWAPKHPKVTTKGKVDKKLKRKDRERSGHYSVVCETPMTGNKRDSQETQHDPTKSVSRALFQE